VESIKLRGTRRDELDLRRSAECIKTDHGSMSWRASMGPPEGLFLRLDAAQLEQVLHQLMQPVGGRDHSDEVARRLRSPGAPFQRPAAARMAAMGVRSSCDTLATVAPQVSSHAAR
jgi:hypothetical protein